MSSLSRAATRGGIKQDGILNDAQQPCCVSQSTKTCLVAFRTKQLFQVLVLTQRPKMQPKAC